MPVKWVSVNELKCVFFTENEARFGGGGFGYDPVHTELDVPDDYLQSYDAMGRPYNGAC